MTILDRRRFLAATAGLGTLLARRRAPGAVPERAQAHAQGGPIAISSGGPRVVTRAVEQMRAGLDPAEAAVGGVTLVEDDPTTLSVGLGGLPNADGIVQLDASVMHGPTHKAGAVAALEGVRNAAQVALTVLRRTDHVMLVGDGAKQFALAHGFPEENLLTDRAREAWLRWKRNANPNDAWLDDDQTIGLPPEDGGAAAEIPFTYGTVHCAALDAAGDLGACTTTSGMSYKIPGRVGDSPIVGAGMFVDNEVGTAGAIGRGESMIQSAGSARVVEYMSRGADPDEACLEVLRWIARHTKRRSLLNERGEPRFGLVLYALRRDGARGGATWRPGGTLSVHDAAGARREPLAALYER